MLGVAPVISDLIQVAKTSAKTLGKRISNVKLAPYREGQKFEEITFELAGKSYTTELKGRNKDAVVGMSPEADKAIAARALLDEHAQPMSPTTSPIQKTAIKSRTIRRGATSRLHPRERQLCV
jgi:hypothetical protein